MVEAVPPGLGGDLRAALVGVAQAAGQAVFDVDADFAVLAGAGLFALGGQQVHVVERHRLAHGADLVLAADQVADDQRALALAEALHDLQARGLVELPEDLRVQGLAGDGGVLDGAEVEAAQVVLDEHPVHRGRRAEGGDVIFRKQRQNLLGVEAVEVVDEDGRLAEPLAVELAPEGLGPAGVGDRQVQAVGVDLVPVFRRDEVAQGIFIIVGRQLRIAGGAGGEEHQHRVGAAGGVLGPGEVAAEEGVFLVEVVPALAAAADEDLLPHLGAFRRRQVDLVGGVAVGGAEDGADVRRMEAVAEVLGLELVGGGDGHGAQLVEAQDGEPELVVALEDEHDPVAPFDAQGLEVVGGPGRLLAHIVEGEAALRAVQGDVEHGQLLRLAAGQLVDHVEGEVELLLVLEGDGLDGAAAVLRGEDEVLVDAALGVLLPGGIGGRGLVGLGLGRRAQGVQHDGVEGTVLAVDGDHAVGRGAVVVNAVALVENLAVLTDLNLHVAPDDEVALLAVVGGQLDVLVLRAGAVAKLHVEGQGDAVLEAGGQVVAGHVVGFLDLLAVAGPRQRVGAELGAVALDQVGDVDAEAQGAAVEKGDVQLPLAALTEAVFLLGDAGAAGHFSGGQAGDLPQLADTARHLANLVFESGQGLGCHGVTSVGRRTKSPSQR